MLPVEPSVLGAFVVAVTALVISPGPDTMVILRHALASGQKSGFAAVVGVQLGLVAHTALAVVGLSLIIASSPVLFKSMALAGAAYLAWLGVQSLRDTDDLGVLHPGSAGGWARACRDGALSNLLNPKVIMLFLALFPNFVETARGDVAAQLITLAVVLIAINVLWQAPIAWAAETVRRWLSRAEVRRAVSRLSGAVLLAFSALMIYEHLV
jgi:threonine/homoserine/homoserine lactone efflux protein